MVDQDRQTYIQIVESENLLNNRYKYIKRMDDNGGNGYFSLMFTAKDLKTGGNNVALKFFDPSKFSDSDRLRRFEREAEMLLELKDERMVINCVGGGIEYLEKKLVDANTGIKFPTLKLPFIALELADYSLEDVIYSKDKGHRPIMSLYLFKEVTKCSGSKIR